MEIDLTNFHKISSDKQKAVINAGFRCFGRYGYSKTSVADIAEAAGIAKASLFQYFGTKQGMYLFLYDFAGKEVAGRATDGTEDYFECAALYVRGLAELGRDYPNLFDFLVLQSQRTDFSEVETLSKVADAICKYNFDTLYSHVDWSKFRDGFDAATVQNLFNWMTCGCISQLSAEMTQEEVYAEMLRYLKLLKTALYKPEFAGGII